MAQFIQDLRYGIRLLGKSPGYSAVAVLALALGIGANSANFAAVQAVLLRPLAFPDLDRIVMLWETLPKLRIERDPVAPANFVDWREQSKAFEHIAAYRGWSANLTGADQPERIQGFLVSPSFFRLLGTRPLLGRIFAAEEEQAGREQVMIVSHGLWQRRLGADRNIVGTSLTLDGRGFTVVGVMPPDFDFPLGAEVWAPLALSAGERSRRGAHNLSVLARLKPGVSLPQARAEMAALASRLERLYPLTNSGRGLLLAPLRETVMSVVTNRFILVGLAAAGIYAVISCLVAQRRHEIGVRMALGARRRDVLNLVVGYALKLALAGLAIGLPAACAMTHVMSSALYGVIALEAATFAEFTLLLAAVALAAGYIPARRATKVDPMVALRHE